jgi:pimeloyl-ACP methyl ester carboxylesterase
MLWKLAAGAVLCAGLLAGCAGGAYSRLAPEDSVPELAAMKARGAALQNHTTLVPTGAEPHVDIAVHEIGDGPRERTLILLHGVLSDSRAWRFVVGDLAGTCNLMLVDLPGCGESDKPDPGLLGASGYSPGAMAGRVLEAVSQRLAARRGDSSRITIVAHSLGGAVAMRMFCDTELAAEYAGVLSRVDGIVLLSPMDISISRPDPMFRRIAGISGTEIALGDATGLLRDRVAEATRGSVVSADRALREEAATRLMYFREPARRHAAQAMLRQAVPWKGERPDWDAIEPVEELYCRIDLPALIVWGRRDETLPVSMGYKLAAELPKARLVSLPGVMHSPHIEAPARCVELIREFVSQGNGAARAGR